MLQDACVPKFIVSHTCIPRDACFPAHISLMHFVLQVIVIYVCFPGYFVFPPFCTYLATM